MSESAFVGAGIGAVLGGMRPIVEIMTGNFSPLALDQILNNAVTLRLRRLAQEAGIDLATLHGSGPGGRIVRADVEAVISAAERAAPRRVAAGLDDQVPLGERTKPQEGFDAPKGPSLRTGAARASGYARRLASGSGVDLANVSGTGPAGAVRARDVRTAGVGPGPASSAAESAPAPPVGETRERAAEAVQHDPVAVRKVIAAAMTRSKRTVPHYYLSSTIDMDAALRWLEDTNRRAPVTARMLSSALLLCATARAARTVPDLNGHWLDDEFRPASDVHIGVVVSLRGGGIMVPTIPDAGALAPPAMIDFLSFVERLSVAGGRIEESDYPRLSTIRSCVDFLTSPR
ncbi:E3 binding domain-containing protein [Nocardia gipuzkoensis]